MIYSLTKVLRSMLAGTVFMTAAWLVCQMGGYRTQRLNLLLLSMVPLAGLMSYSKIFFCGKLLQLTTRMYGLLAKELAVMYFGIAAALFIRFLHMHACLRQRIKCMDQIKPEEYPECMTRIKPAESTKCMTQTKPAEYPNDLKRKIFGTKIRIYLAQDDSGLGPLAGGILNPYIVIPKALKESLSEEEFTAVLCHEALHIRLGHVLVLNIYALLKIIWWVHPLVYLCDWKLRENIEYSSDEGSVMLSTLSAYSYGSVMLKTLRMEGRRKFMCEGTTAFCGDGFAVLKKRLQRLGTVVKDEGALQRFQKKKRIGTALTAAAVVLGLLAVLATSYPRYTKIEEISVFDERMNALTFDLAAEGIKADVTDGEFYISEGEFAKLTAKYGLDGSFVVFSYDTIMKVPGAGGLGQAAMVNLKNPQDVCLLGRQQLVDRLKVFMLKYFI